MNYFYFSGIKIDNISMIEAIEKIELILKNRSKGYIVTPNAFHIVMLQKDSDFRQTYKNASLVLADGFSIVFASRILGSPIVERCAGADIFGKICEIAWKKNKRIFILGGVNGSEKKAEKILKNMYPKIQVQTYSPPFGFVEDYSESERIIEMINRFKTDVLFVCVGPPKSEKWIYRNLENLNIILACPFGAALDFFTGAKKRAPKLLQKVGFEWLWRLILEPRRLWKRYLIGNTSFIILVLKEIFKYFLKKKIKIF